MTEIDTSSPLIVPDEPVDRKTTIIFVDDETRVLDALRRSTRRLRGSWDVHFAEGAEEALALIDELPHVDVVVSDMRMPGMDGADLLIEVRKRSPHSARIILSGQSDREAVLRAVGPAHQYLSKPVDVDEITDVVERLRVASRDVLCDPIRSLIGQVDRLPSPPAVFQRLVELMESDNWTINDVAVELGKDVALTAEILKLVNSAFFGYYGEVTSVNRAVSLVGIELIRGVVLGNKMFEPDNALESWLDLEQLDWRSKSVAHGARAIALREGVPASESATAYLAGMVSEIGLLVMARLPGISPAVAAPLNGATFLDAERAIFGGDRFAVGCQLLRLWGFGSSVVDAIGHLAEPDGEPFEGLDWYLYAARRLVLEERIDPQALVSPVGADLDVDAALLRVRQEADAHLTSAGTAT